MTAVLAVGRMVVIRCPEYWVVGLCVAAWFALLATTGVFLDVGHGSMVMEGAVSEVRRGWLVVIAAPAFHWMVMLWAMMLPLLLGNLRGVAARSFWSRRHRAMVLVILGYVLPWIAFGLVLEAAFRLLPMVRFHEAVPLISVALLAAALWQLTPVKRFCLVRCGRAAILAPSGWRADASCFRYGSLLAGDCCGSCWVLMVVCAAAGHALWATILISAVVWAERFLRRPRLGWSAVILAAAATLTFVGPLPPIGMN